MGWILVSKSLTLPLASPKAGKNHYCAPSMKPIHFDVSSHPGAGLNPCANRPCMAPGSILPTYPLFTRHLKL
uniref:SFRICE_015814 n=1 Tax=Spodoptera frugiperda TaxID=7108 RepID=A0A2H1VRW3_SPOFR